MSSSTTSLLLEQPQDIRNLIYTFITLPPFDGWEDYSGFYLSCRQIREEILFEAARNLRVQHFRLRTAHPELSEVTIDEPTSWDEVKELRLSLPFELACLKAGSSSVVPSAQLTTAPGAAEAPLPPSPPRSVSFLLPSTSPSSKINSLSPFFRLGATKVVLRLKADSASMEALVHTPGVVHGTALPLGKPRAHHSSLLRTPLGGQVDAHAKHLACLATFNRKRFPTLQSLTLNWSFKECFSQSSATSFSQVRRPSNRRWFEAWSGSDDASWGAIVWTRKEVPPEVDSPPLSSSPPLSVLCPVSLSSS